MWTTLYFSKPLIFFYLDKRGQGHSYVLNTQKAFVKIPGFTIVSLLAGYISIWLSVHQTEEQATFTQRSIFCNSLDEPSLTYFSKHDWTSKTPRKIKRKLSLFPELEIDSNYFANSVNFPGDFFRQKSRLKESREN